MKNDFEKNSQIGLKMYFLEIFFVNLAKNFGTICKLRIFAEKNRTFRKSTVLFFLLNFNQKALYVLVFN